MTPNANTAANAAMRAGVISERSVNAALIP